MTPPSTKESTAEPTEEELEAIEPVEVRKETAYYLSKIERAKKKIEDEKKRRRFKGKCSAGCVREVHACAVGSRWQYETD